MQTAIPRHAVFLAPVECRVTDRLRALAVVFEESAKEVEQARHAYDARAKS